MIVEKSFKSAELTGQAGNDKLTLKITPHPAIRCCCILAISERNLLRMAITVNNSELKKVADMLCDNEYKEGGIPTTND